VQFPFPDILDFIVSDKKKKCKLKKKIGGGEKNDGRSWRM
jgi:hypothetical protein